MSIFEFYLRNIKKKKKENHLSDTIACCDTSHFTVFVHALTTADAELAVTVSVTVGTNVDTLFGSSMVFLLFTLV